MKNLLAKLNGPALKKLGIEHGEKIGLGVVVFTCLLILGLGRWRGYSRTPTELNSLSTTTETSINNSEWPEKHRVEHAPVDYIQKSEELLAALDVERYDYKTFMSHPVYRPLEPIKEPQLETVIHLLADYGRGILALPPAGSVSPTELASAPTTGEPTAAAKSKDDEKEALRFNKRKPLTDPNTAATRTAGGADAGGATGHGEGRGRGAGSALEGEDAGMEGGYAAGEATPTGEGRGIRFVSVRGAFPYQKQLEKLAAALRLDFDHQAIDYLEFADFEIQRQRALPGPDPWTDAKWETLNIQAALDVLLEVEGFAADVIDADYTSQVFTMPLPTLVEMDWTRTYANHPLLWKFQLSVKEMEEALIANEKLVEKYAQEEEKKRRGSRGFAAVQTDLREVKRTVLAPSSGMGGMGSADMGNPNPMIREGAGAGMMGPMSSRSGMGGHSAMSMPNPGMQQMARAGGHGQASAIMGEITGEYGGEQGNSIAQRLQLQLVPRYLLFRYLDFDVEPGEAYRYRVRLKIYNPNFGRAPEEVEKPSIVEGEMRETEWSQPSKPAVVETDVQYFLAQVLKKAARAKHEVEWNIFQWAQKEGTYLHEKLKVTFGQFVGGKAETMVLNPAAPSFKKVKDREFRSDDLLVDSYGSPGVGLVPAEHPDLNFNAKATARTASLNIPDQAIVANRFGELVPFDTVSGKQSEVDVQDLVKSERDAFRFLLEQEETAESAAGGLDGYIQQQEGMDDGDGGRAKSKKKTKKKNPLDGRGGAAAAMMGGMMPPGAGGGHGSAEGGDDGGFGGKKSKTKKRRNSADR